LGENRLFWGGCRHDAYEGATLALGVETHFPVDEREEGVVLAEANIGARMEFRTALTDEDVAGDNVLTAELLHAKATAGRITTVTRGAACFFMGHLDEPFLRLAREAGDADHRLVLAMAVLAAIG
jgi:hypothetical protein